MDIFGLCNLRFFTRRGAFVCGRRGEGGAGRKARARNKKVLPQEESQIMSVLNRARGVIRALGPLLYYVVCESSARGWGG